jgi:hypothetical protein
MSSKGRVAMYLFLIILAGLLLHNAAGSVGILLAGGAESDALVAGLEGNTKTASNKGTFSVGGTKIKLGG